MGDDDGEAGKTPAAQGVAQRQKSAIEDAQPRKREEADSLKSHQQWPGSTGS